PKKNRHHFEKRRKNSKAHMRKKKIRNNADRPLNSVSERVIELLVDRFHQFNCSLMGRARFTRRPFTTLLGSTSGVLTDPQAIPIWITYPDLRKTVEGDLQLRHSQAVLANLLVILRNVVRVQINNGLAGGLQMRVDRLIDHQPTLIKTKNPPPPPIVHPFT